MRRRRVSGNPIIGLSSLLLSLCLVNFPVWAVEPRYKLVPELGGWWSSTVPDVTSLGSVTGVEVAWTSLVSCDTIDTNAAGQLSCGTDGGGGGNSFETISIPAGTNPVADSSTDTLTITETSFLSITGTAGTDTIDITQVTTDLGNDGLIAANAVALATDTTGAYVADLTATADETTVSGGGAENATITIGIADPLIVGKGGTGAATLTDGGILLGSGTGAITPLGVATNGQIPIGDGTTDPVLATLTGVASEVDITNGAGSITVDLPASVTLTTSLTVVSTDPADAGAIRLNNAANIAWEASPTGTDVTLGVDASEIVQMDGSVGLALDDQMDLRFYETDANGENFLGFEAPAAITADATCTLENDANPIPDSCVGDGTDAGAGADTNADKEFVWPMVALLPLEAADSIPPIAKDAGTNLDLLVVDFDQSTDECRTVHFITPPDITSGGTVTFTVAWYAASVTTNAVIWDFRHNSGVADAVDPDQVVTTEAAAASTAPGTAGQLEIITWTETQTNLAWVASDIVVGAICRDADNASDTFAADARGVVFGIRIPRS